jgi:hypothetical protein
MLGNDHNKEVLYFRKNLEKEATFLRLINLFLFYTFIIFLILILSGCAQVPTDCPPKSDTQVLIEEISDILVPKIRIGC